LTDYFAIIGQSFQLILSSKSHVLGANTNFGLTSIMTFFGHNIPGLKKLG